MVAYIAFIASLNLCVGYALGVYFGVCPGITPLEDEQEADNDEVIGLQIAEPSHAAPIPSEEIEAEEAEEIVAEAIEAQAIEAMPVEAAAIEAPAIAAASPELQASAPQRSKGPDVASILAGLGDFKAKLEEVSAKLAAVADDREAVDGCAGEMKQANTEYLERTAEVIKCLDQADSTEPGTGEGTLRQTLHDQSEEVRRVNVEIEGLASENDIEQVRQMLLASSQQLVQSAAVIEYTLQSEEESSDKVAHRAMGSIDSMLALIDQEIADRAEDQPLVVAKLAMRPLAGLGEGDAGELLRGIASLVALELTRGQAMFTDPQGHLALTLAGDNEDTASERCERIRQRVASTVFRRGEAEWTAELLCSLTHTRKALRSDEVLGRLEAGLAKAVAGGTGCTIFHNGNSLTIVAPCDLAIEPQVVEL